MSTSADGKDEWNTKSYQSAASFVPLLTTKVLQLLSPQIGETVLDIGCGDGVLTLKIAAAVTVQSPSTSHRPTGHVTGLDSSTSFISTAHSSAKTAGLDSTTTFSLHDCRRLSPPSISSPPFPHLLRAQTYDKIFSNAAMHWILRDTSTRISYFSDVFALLKPGGTFVFEMGGHGNINEIHAALVGVLHLGYNIPIAAIQAANPWFFASEPWMRRTLLDAGFEVEVCESEERPTLVTQGEGGGLEGWVRVMCGRFLELVGDDRRERVVGQLVEVLSNVCAREDGGVWLGYVRLRARARRPVL